MLLEIFGHYMYVLINDSVLFLQPVIVHDVSSFKRDLALYPLAKPYIDLQKAVSKL